MVEHGLRNRLSRRVPDYVSPAAAGRRQLSKCTGCDESTDLVFFFLDRYRSLIARAMDREPLLAANAPWWKPVPSASRTDRFDPSTRSMYKHSSLPSFVLPAAGGSTVLPDHQWLENSKNGKFNKKCSKKKKAAVDRELRSKRLSANRKSDVSRLLMLLMFHL